MLESWYRDFVLGFRGLRKSPVFCLTAILTLAIGIGANTAVFTLLYGLLLRSLPVTAPQQLARISLVNPGESRAMPFIRYQMLQQLRRQQSSFVDISAWTSTAVAVEDREGALREYVSAGLVSGNSFELFGIRPYVGRLIASSDDVRGGPAAGWPVVLSYGFWKDRFGGNAQVIGTPLEIGNTVVTVVGVTPPSFQGVWPGVDPKLYLPIQYLPVLAGRDDLNSPTSSTWCSAIGRLKPGVSFDAANAEIAVYQQQLLQEFSPAEYARQPLFRSARLTVESARTGLPTFFGRTYSAPLYLMQGLVAIVLLLCCVNVSGLMLSKIHERQHEFALRTALGAGRTRLMRQYLTESFVIACAGAALGSTMAWNGSGLLLQFFRDPNMLFGMSVQPDHTVFLVTALFAVLTTLFFGILPAWKAGRSDPGSLLKSRTAAQQRIGGRVFVAIQISLSLVLVAVATLLSQSLIRLRGEHTGFDLNHVTIQTPPFHLLRQQAEARLDFYQRMVDRIEQAPGVQSAAVTWYTPMTGDQATAWFQAPTRAASAPENMRMAYNDVGPGYFRTMKTTILEGREFEKQERDRSVCILNQAAAGFLFPRQAPLGGYVRSTDVKQFPEPVTCRVIGVAEDAKFGSLREPPPRTIYFPVTKDTVGKAGNLVFLMNAPSKAQAIAGYREALRAIAPTIPLVLFATLQEQMDASLGSERAIALLSTFFGGVALFLSAIGLYGMLSSSVTQRTGEIGIRVALGAPRGAVLRMVLSDALRLVGVGLLLGTVALLFTVQSVKHMLYGVSAFDPTTLLATAALLTIVALIAGLIPALRAASIDPLQAMRSE
jgi:putative ABC transport system permease protein